MSKYVTTTDNKDQQKEKNVKKKSTTKQKFSCYCKEYPYASCCRIYDV